MSSALLRIRAIVSTDVRIRIRRGSTAAIFLLLCITAYLWIPDPSTGRALLQMKEQRALYNSPALAMATASLCAILLGLVGYYLVSNSIGRDTRTRTGFIIASTTVRNGEYLTGIFLGNLIFLSIVATGFMLSCIVMQMVRGEAPVQLTSFLWHYLILLPPMLVFVSAIAVLFESIRWLSGRFGDLAYFFVWMFVLAGVAVSVEKITGRNWTSYFDTYSFAFMLEQVKKITHSDAISIGSSKFDTTKPPFIFPGLSLTKEWIAPRIVSTLYPIVFVAASLLFFKRFNPTKVKASQLSSRRSLIGIASSLIKPLVVPLLSIASIPLKPGRMNAILSETLLTFRLHPLLFFAVLGFAIVSLLSEMSSLQLKVLPAAFVTLALILADLPIRERRAGTTPMIESLPYLKRDFILWKVGTAMMLSMLLLFIPAVRLLLQDPSAAISLLIGTVFLACSATGLGLASGNPKTFMVSFLLFLYIVMNDSGKTSGLDFAGWYGTATAIDQCIYAALSSAMMILAFIVRHFQQR